MSETVYPVQLEVDVAWGDLDALGHVNNTVYFRFFESARIAYMDQLGISVAAGGSGGPILARTSCDFKRPLGYPDRVRVEAGVPKLGNSSLTMVYRVFSLGLNQEVALGDSVLVWFDYQAQRSIPIPDELRAKIGVLEKKNLAPP